MTDTTKKENRIQLMMVEYETFKKKFVPHIIIITDE
jgi:hypothetical protein